MKKIILKKIGIDCRMLSFSGIGRRIEGILNHLKPFTNKFEFYLFGNLNELESFRDQGFQVVEYTKKVYSISELWGHRKMNLMDLIDIPHFNVSILHLRKSIVTIHDIIPFKMKMYHKSFLKQVYLRIIFILIKYFSKSVIAVSEYTKKDLMENFSFQKHKINVIYNGIDFKDFYNHKKINSIFLKKYKLPKDYLLSIGIDKRHKNFEFVFENLLELSNQIRKKIYWVLAGTSGKYPEFINNEKLKYSNLEIIVLPKLLINELSLLYSYAQFLIHPSLYEGFGFPVLEANACGCPVLSSNATVLPEILKSSALYFDPSNSISFQTNFLKIIGNKKEQKKLKDLGLKNVKNFSWEKSIQKIVKIYSKI